MGCDILVVSGMAFEAALAQETPSLLRGGSGWGWQQVRYRCGRQPHLTSPKKGGKSAPCRENKESSTIRTVYGLDPAKLIADIEQAVQGGAKAIISFGTAAGLQPELSPGAIVIAKQIHTLQQVFATDEGWANALLSLLPNATYATLAGVDHPIASVQEKAVLCAQTGAVAADMESHLAARVAQKYNLPFAALRVVLDNAHCTLPPAALVATKPSGHVDYIKLIGSLLRQPQQLSALTQLGRDHAVAKQALADCCKLLMHGSGCFGFGLR